MSIAGVSGSRGHREKGDTRRSQHPELAQCRDPKRQGDACLCKHTGWESPAVPPEEVPGWVGCLGPRSTTLMPSHWQDLEPGADLPSSLKKGTQPTNCCGECMCEAFRRARGLQSALRKCSRIYPAMRNQRVHIKATQDGCHLCSSHLMPPCLFPGESQPRPRPPDTQGVVPTLVTSSHQQGLLRTAPVSGNPWAQKTGQRMAGPAGDRHLSPCWPGAGSPKKAFWPKKITSSGAGARAPMPVCACVCAQTFLVLGASQHLHPEP